MIKYVGAVPRKFSDCTGYSDDKVAKYFGGDRTLSESKVVELLVSTSFGANSILYAVWLGYVMGMWAMLIHFAWCMSFLGIARYSKQIYIHTSIHDFLSCHFGTTVKKVSAICSCVGLLYFTGWEIAIAKSSLESFVEQSAFGRPWLWSTLIVVTVLIALLYTVVGGQRANGYVNLVVNRVKIALLGIVIISIIYALHSGTNFTTSVEMPSFSSAIKNIGLVGLITNIFINFFWQFVDNSSWQIISAGCVSENSNSDKALIRAGCRIFLIYAGETFIGASLRSISGLDSNSILSGLPHILGALGSKVIIPCIVILVLLSMMSLVDGMALSVAQTFMIDLKIDRKANPSSDNRQSSIDFARVLTAALGVLGAMGIQVMLFCFGKSIFDFVYVFTLVQLSLIGPVIVGLVFRPQYIPRMWSSIVISLVLGFSFSILSAVCGVQWIGDAAATVTAICSLLISFLLYMINAKGNKPFPRIACFVNTKE